MRHTCCRFRCKVFFAKRLKTRIVHSSYTNRSSQLRCSCAIHSKVLFKYSFLWSLLMMLPWICERPIWNAGFIMTSPTFLTTWCVKFVILIKLQISNLIRRIISFVCVVEDAHALAKHFRQICQITSIFGLKLNIKLYKTSIFIYFW